MIAYRKDRLVARGGHEINTWEDLLQPKLRGRIAMTESSREFIGIALKAALSNKRTPSMSSNTEPVTHHAIGTTSRASHDSTSSSTTTSTVSRSRPSTNKPVGFNTSAAELKRRGYSEGDVADMLAQMREQIKLFSNRDHVRALTAGKRYHHVPMYLYMNACGGLVMFEIVDTASQYR